MRPRRRDRIESECQPGLTKEYASERGGSAQEPHGAAGKGETPHSVSVTAPRGVSQSGVLLKRRMKQIAARLRREFAAEIERAPPGFKRRAARLLKTLLPPRPGRPCDDNITRAIELRSEEKAWKEVYPICIPAYETLERDARYWAQLRLRDAVRSRRNTQKRRKSQTDFSSPSKSPA
jgi:hypothetical protein